VPPQVIEILRGKAPDDGRPDGAALSGIVVVCRD